MKDGLIKERKVRGLLNLGMAVIEISKIIGLPINDVLRIGNIPSFPRITPIELKELPKDEPEICPTCNGKVIFWPCLACNPEAGRGSSKPVLEPQQPSEIPRAESLELLHIAEDLCEIQKHGLVTHPLFISLAVRAGNVLTRITGPRQASQGNNNHAPL